MSPRVAARAALATEATASVAAIPVFFINRDCDTARLESVNAYLQSAGLNAERIPGVEGLAVPDQFRSFFFQDDKVHSNLRPGEIGCYASHLIAMQQIVERNLDYALILEDDASFPANTAETIADILADLPADWDLVHLCKDSNRAIKTIAPLRGDRRLIRYSRVPETTTGYLISRAGAEKFLKPSKRYWPIDTDFRRPWSFNLEIYGVTPRLIDASGFESAIHAVGDHSRLRRGLPIPSRHCWTGNPLHTPESIFFNLRTLGPVSWMLCAAHNGARRAVSVLGLKPLMRRLGLSGIGSRLAENLAVR